jgi:hypothetical protein
LLSLLLAPAPAPAPAPATALLGRGVLPNVPLLLLLLLLLLPMLPMALGYLVAVLGWVAAAAFLILIA